MADDKVQKYGIGLEYDLQGLDRSSKDAEKIIRNYVKKVENLHKEQSRGEREVIEENKRVLKQAQDAKLKEIKDHIAHQIQLYKEDVAAAKAAEAEKIKAVKMAVKAEYDAYREEQYRINEERKKARQQEIKDEKQKQSLYRMSSAAAIGGGVLTGAMGLGVMNTARFEQDIARVGAKSDATREQINQLKDSALSLTKYGFNTTELVEAENVLASMGFTADQINKSFGAIVVSSRASGSPIAETAETIAKTMTVFGKAADQASNVADVLAMADIKSAANLQTMYYAMNYAAAPAKSLGISFEQLSASIMILANAGVRAETIGTSLRGGLLKLAERDTIQNLKKLGIEIVDSSGNLKDMGSILDEFKTKLSGLTSLEKTQVLSKIFDRTAVSAWLTLIDQGSGKLNNFTTMLHNVDGASRQLAGTIQDNLMGDIQKLTGDLNRLTISVNEGIMPALRPVIQGIDSIVGALNEVPRPITAAITGFVGFSAVTFTVLGTVGLAIVKFKELKQASQELAVAQGILNAVSLKNPWIIGLAALVGVTAGIMAYTQHVREANNATKHLNEANQKSKDIFSKESGELMPLVNEFDALAKIKAKTRSEAQRLNEVKQKLIDKFPALRKQIQGAITDYTELSKATKMAMAAELAHATAVPLAKNVARTGKRLNEFDKSENSIGSKAWEGLLSVTDKINGNNRNSSTHAKADAARRNKLEQEYNAAKNALRMGEEKAYNEAMATFNTPIETKPEAGGGLTQSQLNDFFSKKKNKKKGFALTGFEKEMTNYNNQVSLEEQEKGDKLYYSEKLELYRKYVSEHTALDVKNKDLALKQQQKYNKWLADLEVGSRKEAFERLKYQYSEDIALNDYSAAQIEQRYEDMIDKVVDARSHKVGNNLVMGSLNEKESAEVAKTKKQLRLATLKEEESDQEQHLITMNILEHKSELDRLKGEENLAKDKVAIWKGVSVVEYKKAQLELLQATETRVKKEIELEVFKASALQKHAESELEIVSMKVKHLRNMGQISSMEEIKLNQAVEEQLYQVKKDGLDKQIELNKNYPDAVMALNQQLKELDDEHKRQMIANQYEIEENAKFSYRRIVSDFKDSFQQGLSGLIQGSQSFTDAVWNIIDSFSQKISDKLAESITDGLFGSTNKKDIADMANSVRSQFESDLKNKSGDNSTPISNIGQDNNNGSTGLTDLINMSTQDPGQLNVIDKIIPQETMDVKAEKYKGLMNTLGSHTRAFVTLGLGAWSMLAQGGASKWTFLAAVGINALTALGDKHKRVAIGQALSDAWTAASSGWKSGMQMPFPTNLVMAPALAAYGAAFPLAKAAAIGTIGFAQGVVDLPKDMVAPIHKGEMILPKPFAEDLRTNPNLKALFDGGKRQNKEPEVLQPITLSVKIDAIDSTGVEEVFKNNSRGLITAVRSELRRFNYGGAI